eukprot:GEMP01010576.1.p1 GENE.GEMP01010576.1~~GEMP01010576.1.p1  ORF type:complete len:465 (+),score=106.13 GEMP01010576.1:76-1470(+)
MAVSAILFLAQFCSVQAVISKEVFFARQPAVTSAPRTLVIHDATNVKKSHSKFFEALQARGHQLSYEKYDAKTLPLLELGELKYDNVILFTPTMNAFPRKSRMTKKAKQTQEEITETQTQSILGAKNLSLKDIADFVDIGGNVFIGTTRLVGQDLRKLANECGVEFDAQESSVVDHVHKHAKDTGDHSLVFAGAIREDNKVVTGNVDGSKVLYRGAGHSIGAGTLSFNILHGSPTAYSWGPGGLISTNAKTNLVSAMQARNGARVLFTGSLEMCSNEIYALSSENEKFCDEVSKWTFREKAVLRWDNLTSHKVGEEHIGTPYMYRMKDDIVFKIDIKEYENGQWKPFHGPDVQLELVMLDPYVRIFLDPPTDGATFSKTFQAPDRYGIFKFRIIYHRRGYNHVHVEHLAPLRNFKHNDYDRFLWVASPYYAVCLMTPFSLLIVSFLFLYHREKVAANALPATDH